MPDDVTAPPPPPPPMHPATAALLGYFSVDHLPDGPLRAASAPFGELAHTMAAQLPAGPETTTCLRKLLEAKDCAVRAAL